MFFGVNKQQLPNKLARYRHINVVEVGARDGLQNEQFFVPTQVKQKMIEMLCESGLRDIEVTSFVSPKWVPQMADSKDLFARVKQSIGNNNSNSSEKRLPVLVPNVKGLEEAVAAGATDIAVFTAASDSFNKRNINCDVKESLTRLQAVVEAAKKGNQIKTIRGYVSCVIGCPFEGHVDPQRVVDVTEALLSMGCFQVSLGDTIGVGTVGHWRRLLGKFRPSQLDNLAVHCHDTYGQALANIACAVEEFNINTVDSAVAGLGGCPFAPGATGNVATEDVVYMLNGLGHETGVNIMKLVEAGDYICKSVPRRNESRAAVAILKSRYKQ